MKKIVMSILIVFSFATIGLCGEEYTRLEPFYTHPEIKMDTIIGDYGYPDASVFAVMPPYVIRWTDKENKAVCYGVIPTQAHVIQSISCIPMQ